VPSRTLLAALAVTLSTAALTAALPTPGAGAASPSPTPAPSSSTGPVVPANPATVVTFGVQPAIVRGYDPRSFFSWNVTPGGHLTDEAAVLNFSVRPIRLGVLVADAVNTNTGGFALLNAGQKATDVGSWLSMPGDLKTVVVPARTAHAPGRVLVPLSLSVPGNAQPGDHVGGIVVSLQSEAKSPTGQRYKLVQRVGSRIFVRVIGKLNPQLSVTNLSATYHGTANPVGRGYAVVTYTVRNTGNVALGAQQSVTVTGLFGTSAAADRLAQIPLLLPGSQLRLQARVPGVLPTIFQTATVRLAPLVLPGSQEPPAGPWSASTRFWAVPWALIALVLLLLAALGYYLWRRRRAAGNEPPPDSPAADREPEVVTS